MRFRFPRQARLIRARDYESVFRLGERVDVFPLRVRALRRDDCSRDRGGAMSRLGLAVGRKVGKANVRNRWKRAIRQAFRLHRHELDPPYDLVVTVSWHSTAADLARTEEAFLSVIAALRPKDAPGACRPEAATAPPAERPGEGAGAGGPALMVRTIAAALRAGGAALGRAVGSVFVALLRCYQLLVSPLLPPACRFQPSCSQYMIDAVRRKGAIRGVVKGLWRLLRCNPFCRGGYDPVE